MINNVVDHSESKDLIVQITRNAKRIEIIIIDHGVGIFEKIRRNYNYEDPRDSILELSKGKLTTDPERHTGEGVFFTSRMFQDFIMRSGELAYVRSKDDDEWLIEVWSGKNFQGTAVTMKIDNDTSYSDVDIFRKYEDDEQRFTKTHVPVTLARYGDEQLVSRSQARRVLTRFNKFSEVILDFHNVERIGHAFADEIFRVFKKEHPEVDIVPINMTPAVSEIINRVSANGSVTQVNEQNA